MQVAHIAPPSLCEDVSALGKYHLVLPHMLLTSEVYARVYWGAASRGDYVILDNGEAEGLAVNYAFNQLCMVAMSGDFKEIVLPDTMGDLNATMVATGTALTKIPMLVHDKKLSFMAVLQGQTMEELKMCLDFYTSLELRAKITTIGIPRHVVGSVDQHARFEMAQLITEKYPRFKIHLLGASPIWVDEVKDLVKLYPFIRGIDTSLAFNAAAANIDLAMIKGGYQPQLPIHRPINFAMRRWNDKEKKLVHRNISTINGWAQTS